jgi:hypothetical protein
MEPETKTALAAKTDEDLLAIWVTNDRQQWHSETFDAIRLILAERGISAPAQGEPPPPAAPPLSTIWLTIYTHVRLPLCALGWLLSLLRRPTSPWPILWGLGWAAVYVGLAVGLHRRRAGAWRANWVLFAIETVGVLFGTLQQSKGNPKQFVAVTALWTSIWVIPNVIYFRKRRGLFADIDTSQQALAERDA